MIRAALLPLLCWFVVGCGPPQSSQPDPTAPTPAKHEPAPTAGGESPLDKKKQQKTIEEQIAEAIARVPEIQKEVAELRGLEFKEPVPAEYQPADDFRAYLARDVEKELPPEKNKALSRAAYHLGLVKQPLDVAQTMLDAFATQAAAYYDPLVNKFFIVSPFGGPGGLAMITAHELVHGVQHHNFDLLAYYGQEPKQELTEDELNARRFVVEGEATLIMIDYMTGKNLIEGKNLQMLGAAISMMAAQDTHAQIREQKQMAGTVADPKIREQMEAMDQIPLYIMVPLIDSYTRGAVQAFEAYKSGGWDAVNALYKNPPDSTEQVLHPATKLVGKRDYPVAITPPKPSELKGYAKIHSEVMGELSWRAYFMTWSVDEPEKRAEGWDGDRVEVWTKGEATAAQIATTWDSKADAADFAAGYAASVKKRFPRAESEVKGAVTTHARPDGTVVMIEHRGVDVFIVDGADSKTAAKLIKRLRKSKKKRHKNDKG